MSGRPDWARRGPSGRETVHLDARPILAAGGEPLDVILETAAAVAPGGVLILEAPFEPVPLFDVLAAQGFDAFAEPLGPTHWRIWFRRARP